MANRMHDLLGREVDRKQFLIEAGGLTLAILGISGLIRALTEAGTPTRTQGYGSASYGGERELGRISRKAD